MSDLRKVKLSGKPSSSKVTLPTLAVGWSDRAFILPEERRPEVRSSINFAVAAFIVHLGIDEEAFRVGEAVV